MQTKIYKLTATLNSSKFVNLGKATASNNAKVTFATEIATHISAIHAKTRLNKKTVAETKQKDLKTTTPEWDFTDMDDFGAAFGAAGIGGE